MYHDTYYKDKIEYNNDAGRELESATEVSLRPA